VRARVRVKGEMHEAYCELGFSEAQRTEP